jgi:nitroreductase
MGGPGFEEVLFTTRAMRRLRPDPVPEAELRYLIEAATQAASAHNSQTWGFVVVTERAQRQRIADAYRVLAERAVKPGADGSMGLPEEERRIWANAYEFGKRFHEVPALIVCCMRATRPDTPVGGSSFYGSIYPAIQNLMLAARYRGLGTVLTTLHLSDEPAFKKILELPDDVCTVAIIPVGYPTGEWKRPVRKPAEGVTHWNRWDPKR